LRQYKSLGTQVRKAPDKSRICPVPHRWAVADRGLLDLGITDRSSLLLGGAFLVVAVGIFYSPKIEKALGISRDQSYKAPTEQYDKLGK
jgi:hypothetical protein